jgi:hypothetical protein
MKRTFFAILLGATAHAALLYNNLGDTFYSNNQLTQSTYQSFSSDSTDLFLDDLKLTLDIKGPDTGTFAVNLYSDSSTHPGSLLLNIGNVNDTSLTTTATVYDFLIADYALTANTRYWIGLIPNASIQGSWESSMPAGGDTGVSGQYADYGSSVFLVGPATAPAGSMSIDAVTSAATTPEPSSVLLAAAGFVVMLWLRRRPA